MSVRSLVFSSEKGDIQVWLLDDDTVADLQDRVADALLAEHKLVVDPASLAIVIHGKVAPCNVLFSSLYPKTVPALQIRFDDNDFFLQVIRRHVVQKRNCAHGALGGATDVDGLARNAPRRFIDRFCEDGFQNDFYPMVSVAKYKTDCAEQLLICLPCFPSALCSLIYSYAHHVEEHTKDVATGTNGWPAPEILLAAPDPATAGNLVPHPAHATKETLLRLV